jgi:hypothetical protein
MKITERHYMSPIQRGYGVTLHLWLTLLIVTAVSLVLSIGILVDQYRAYQQYIDLTLASLEEQARALKLAHSKIKEVTDFASYVDDFCAQMNDHISPGHHILILDETGAVIIRSRHHSGAEV